MKKEKSRGWLITGGTKSTGSYIFADFLRFTLHSSIIDRYKNRIKFQLPSAPLRNSRDTKSSKDLITKFVGRRQGNFDIVVSDSLKAEHVIGLRAKHNLTEMVASNR